jgi:hypothetical protein
VQDGVDVRWSEAEGTIGNGEDFQLGWKAISGVPGSEPGKLVVVCNGKWRASEAVVTHVEATLRRLKIGLVLEQRRRRTHSGDDPVRPRGQVSVIGMWSFPSAQFDDVVTVIKWATGDEDAGVVVETP